MSISKAQSIKLEALASDNKLADFCISAELWEFLLPEVFGVWPEDIYSVFSSPLGLYFVFLN